MQFENLQFQGFPVKYYMPEEPVAVVWAFHGTNGSIAYASEPETIAVLNELILEGFGFIATESTEQGNDNQWDISSTDPAENADLERLFALRDHMIEISGMDTDTPEYAIGFSQGGGFSGHFAESSLLQGVDFRATAPHLSGGGAWGLDIPVMWCIAVNDEQAAAEEEYASRVDQGLPSELLYIPEFAITPEYFTKVPGNSLELSQNTRDEMLRLGMIDEAGNRLPTVPEAEPAISEFIQEAKVASPTTRADEIRVAWALHRMNGYYAKEVRDWFLQWL